MFRNFLLGMLSVFRLGRVSIKNAEKREITDHLDSVAKDVNNAFEKLKKNYERN